MNKTYSEIVALARLKEIELKNSGLINGNFSAVANQNKIKVKRLRELYELDKPTPPNKKKNPINTPPLD